MKETDSVICTACPLYACRVCRTKTGWKHQRWCRMAEITQPGCEACRYYDAEGNACAHPAQRKGGIACREKVYCSL